LLHTLRSTVYDVILAPKLPLSCCM